MWAEVLKQKVRRWWAFSNSVLSHRWIYDEKSRTEVKCELAENARSEVVYVTWRKVWQIGWSEMHNKNKEVDI